MKDSLAAILEEMERKMTTSDDRINLDDSTLIDSSGGSQIEVASCRNSISTESAFAFSQADVVRESHADAPQRQVSLLRVSDRHQLSRYS